jgi:Glycosyl hydrolases family 2, sugar binding domain
MTSRRQFLSKSALVAAALASTRSPAENPDARGARADTETISLCGTWAFQIDPDDLGTKKSWHTPDYSTPQWRDVTVPHAWQIDPAHTEYRGIGWYRRSFEALLKWQDAAVRLQFEAVFHTATVWVNGQMAGEHARKGYTAFTLDITPMLRLGQSNLIAVRVDNAEPSVFVVILRTAFLRAEKPMDSSAAPVMLKSAWVLRCPKNAAQDDKCRGRALLVVMTCYPIPSNLTFEGAISGDISCQLIPSLLFTAARGRCRMTWSTPIFAA